MMQETDFPESLTSFEQELPVKIPPNRPGEKNATSTHMKLHLHSATENIGTADMLII